MSKREFALTLVFFLMFFGAVVLTSDFENGFYITIVCVVFQHVYIWMRFGMEKKETNINEETEL